MQIEAHEESCYVDGIIIQLIFTTHSLYTLCCCIAWHYPETVQLVCCWLAALCRAFEHRSDPGSAAVNFTCFTLSTAHQGKFHGLITRSTAVAGTKTECTSASVHAVPPDVIACVLTGKIFTLHCSLFVNSTCFLQFT